MVTRYGRMLAVKDAKGCAVSSLTGDLAPLQASHFGVVLVEGGCDKDGDDNVLALMRFPNNHRPRLGGTRVAVLTR